MTHEILEINYLPGLWWRWATMLVGLRVGMVEELRIDGAVVAAVVR